MVALIEIWLTNQNLYVEVNGMSSIFYESNSRTIEGSILGQILYAIFIAPLFDLMNLFNFVDDNFTLSISNSKHQAMQIILINLP